MITINAIRYLILVTILAFGLLALAGCSLQDLRKGESRKMTAWGIWAVLYGAPIGIGYWHSERGPDVESEESAKPGLPTGQQPLPVK